LGLKITLKMQIAIDLRIYQKKSIFLQKNVIKHKAVVTMAHSMHIIGITNQKLLPF